MNINKDFDRIESNDFPKSTNNQHQNNIGIEDNLDDFNINEVSGIEYNYQQMNTTQNNEGK